MAVQQFVVLCALNYVRYISAIYYLYQVLLRDQETRFFLYPVSLGFFVSEGLLRSTL